MPLKRGSSDKTVSANIGEMMRDYKQGDGKIGHVKPKSDAHARKIAAAAALRKAGRAKR